MANAKQCDRCGSFYTDEVTNPQYTIGKQVRCLNFTTGIFRNSTRTLDICPECNASFMDWMDELTREVDKVDEEGHYEYCIFDEDNEIFSCLHIQDKNEAIAYMEQLKRDHPTTELHLRKRLIMAWEPVEEDEDNGF